jgi:hypothetical protein
VIAEVEQRVAALDPGAETLLELSCVECGNTWELGFEPDEFLWREVAASALRLLRQVHVLARAYGWGESDVLALGPQRREAYLTLVGSA